MIGLLHSRNDNVAFLFRHNVPLLVSLPDVAPDSSTLTFDPQITESSSSSKLNPNIGDIVSRFSDSLTASVENGHNTISSSLDSINSCISSITKSVTEALENVKCRLSSTVDQVGESAIERLADISSDFREAVSKSGLVGVNVLRRAIVAIEESFGKGDFFVVFSFSSAKVSFAIQELERNLGLDPSDPLVSFSLFVTTASALWDFYWLWTYSGYSGDLSPKLTFELLIGKENEVAFQSHANFGGIDHTWLKEAFDLGVREDSAACWSLWPLSGKVITSIVKILLLMGLITIYRRFASYQDPEGFKQDLRQLLVPVKLGAQAFSRAAVET
ncbi:hypothetical protein SAY86_003727 [Trapa natans]|uniref:Uncharacterized protein n=1 Tax=Trapa natans TaxID=22666 RepID=A0AAN7MDB2_TRANT|nr:hypothetical protein SAY86_003727 [Trapa natans]